MKLIQSILCSVLVSGLSTAIHMLVLQSSEWKFLAYTITWSTAYTILCAYPLNRLLNIWRTPLVIHIGGGVLLGATVLNQIFHLTYASDLEQAYFGAIHGAAISYLFWSRYRPSP